MIYAQKVSKIYGEVKALQELSLLIEDGEFVALLGPNGSGKSTLFKSLLGIHAFDGSIRVNGLDPLRDGNSVRRSIGYVPQQSGLHLDLTLQETLSFYAKLKRTSEDRAMQLLEELQLTHKLHSYVGDLSGGMRQRLSFAVAMLSDPAILLLDEPTASLDRTSQEMILSWLVELNQHGKTILISTHSKQDIVALAGRAITLEEGKLISDSILQTARPNFLQEASACFTN